MGYAEKTGMAEFVHMLVSPNGVKGYVDGLATDGKGRGYVAFERIAHHHHFGRRQLQGCTQFPVGILVFFRDDGNVMEQRI